MDQRIKEACENSIEIQITGLLLYGLIVLPLLVPAVTVSFGNGAWWPFGNRNSKNK